VACLAGHSAEMPREYEDYRLCLDLKITPAELRQMDAIDVETLQTIRAAERIAELKWNLCMHERGKKYPYCPDGGVDYLNDVCIKCIERKEKNEESQQQHRLHDALRKR